MAEREPQSATPARKLYDNPVRQFASDVLAADKRAAKGKGEDGKDGQRPSERIAGAILMAAFGMAAEPVIEKIAPEIAKKHGFEDVLKPGWKKEVILDGITTGAYLFVRKQTGDQLPQVKIPDLAMAFGSDVAMALAKKGGERAKSSLIGVRVKSAVDDQNRKLLTYLFTEPEKSRLKRALIGTFDRVNNGATKIAQDTGWIAARTNPVTIGAGRESWEAFRDLLVNYRAVVAGEPETLTMQDDGKGPTSVTHETTNVFFVSSDEAASHINPLMGTHPAAA